MASAQATNPTIIDDDGLDVFLTDDQLLSRTARYLNILEQRMQQPGGHQINPQVVQKLYTRRSMLRRVHELLRNSHKIIQRGDADGFVYGLVAHGRVWTAASDSLRTWWKDGVNFDRNAPMHLIPAHSEQKLELRALMELQDTTLASIISALMQKCDPPQRTASFEKKIPVSWWPTGQEPWYPELNMGKGGRAPYKKPHDLKKKWKVAVLTAIIKNIAPEFDKMRTLVSVSQTLQHRMSFRENEIWLGVLRGEEHKMKGESTGSPGSSDLDNVTGSGGTVTDQSSGVVVHEEGESSGTNQLKRAAAASEHENSTPQQGDF